MDPKKNISENWIVLFGIFFLFVTFYKYNNISKFEKNYIKEKSSAKSAAADLILNRITTSKKKENVSTEETTNTVLGFENSSERFNRALTYKKETSRTPAQNNPKKSLAEHSLLQLTHWKIWLNTQVVKKDETTDANTLARVNNFSIVESEENMSLSEFDTTKAIAVFDERLKKAGLITGVLKIQTSDKSRLQNDLKTYQAQISDEFENIETYFIKSTEPVFNLELLYQNLKNQHYIKNVELEILSKSYDKN